MQTRHEDLNEIPMETKFNSQICSSIEQSRRLLELGLKKETADMVYRTFGYIEDEEGNKERIYEKPQLCDKWNKENDIPAWSLHRLIEMLNEEMYGGLLCIFKDSIRYEEAIMDRLEAHFEVVGENMYENVISTIEWLIKEGYFNKEYLV